MVFGNAQALAFLGPQDNPCPHGAQRPGSLVGKLQLYPIWCWARLGEWRWVGPGPPTEVACVSPRNYSAVCVYSLGDIDKVFRTSSLKGYHSDLPNPRPGKVSGDTHHGPGPNPIAQPHHRSGPVLLSQCLPDRQPIPTETFQVADSHPEVVQRVEPMGPLKAPLFHSKYHYQKVVVHRMHASNGETFHVLYLTTGEGLPGTNPSCPPPHSAPGLLCKNGYKE